LGPILSAKSETDIEKLAALLREINAVLQDQNRTLTLKVTYKARGGEQAVAGLTVKLQRLDRFEGWQTILPPASAPVQTDGNGTVSLSYATDNNDEEAPVIRDSGTPIYRWQIEDPRDGTILYQGEPSLLDQSEAPPPRPGEPPPSKRLPKAVSLEVWQYAPETDYELAASLYGEHGAQIEAAAPADRQQVIANAADNDPVNLSQLIAMYWSRQLARNALGAGALPVESFGDGNAPNEESLKQYLYGLLRSDALLHTSYTGPFDDTETITASSDATDLLYRAALIDRAVITGLLRARVPGSDRVPLAPILVSAKASELEATRARFTEGFRKMAAAQVGSGWPGKLGEMTKAQAAPRELEALIKALSSDQPGGVWAAVKRFANARPRLGDAALAGGAAADGGMPGWAVLKALGCLSSRELATVVGAAWPTRSRPSGSSRSCRGRGWGPKRPTRTRWRGVGPP
jgi:hypothetical protein